MRVAWVCADPGVPVFGCKGSSIHAQEIIRALRRRGAEVDVFATRPGDTRPDDLSDVRMHSLPKLCRDSAAAREQSALAANSGLREALREAGPFDLVYERYSLWSFAGMEFAQESGIPGLLEVNAPLIEEQSQHRTLVDRQAATCVAHRVCGAASGLFAVSQAVADYIRQFQTDSSRIHVVANGVDPDRFAGSRTMAVPAERQTFTVGFVGTLKKWHGLPVLMKAFTTLYDQDERVRLLIVGDGPERNTLTDTLTSTAPGLQQAVTLTGAVRPDMVPRMLASMDLAVAPYPQTDHFYFSPLKIYEYMAAGLPVVASRVAGLEKLIEHDVNGMLCPPGDAGALAQTIVDLRRDPQKMQRLGHNAQLTVREQHTWDHVLERILGHAQTADLRESVYAEGRT